MSKPLFSEVVSEDYLEGLSADKLKKLVSAASSMRKRKYGYSKKPIYGNINRGFTEEELARFLSCVENDKARFAFELMAGLGLRIGEVVRIKESDIDFVNQEILVHTEKANTKDILPIHDSLYRVIQLWVQVRSEHIRSSKGYLLYSDNPVQSRNHISPAWLRKVFRQARQASFLSVSYGRSRGRDSLVPERPLYRLTPHSLRHYFITKVWRATGDPELAQRLARHTDSRSTHTYIFVAKNDLRKAINTSFDSPLPGVVR